MASPGGALVQGRERRLGPIERALLRVQIEQQINEHQRGDYHLADAGDAGGGEAEQEQG